MEEDRDTEIPGLQSRFKAWAQIGFTALLTLAGVAMMVVKATSSLGYAQPPLKAGVAEILVGDKADGVAEIEGDLFPATTDISACMRAHSTFGHPVKDAAKRVDELLAQMRPQLLSCFESGACRLEETVREGKTFVTLVTKGCAQLPWEPAKPTTVASMEGGVR